MIIFVHHEQADALFEADVLASLCLAGLCICGRHEDIHEVRERTM